jgi:AcrR family transcriptional regulator
MTGAAKRPYRRAEETRQRVLDVADRLFYTEGIRAVGIDRLATEAGITTATLYRLFGSKDGLITAYLRRRGAAWFDQLERAAQGGGLASFFDELDAQARGTAYRGCPFRMALAEFPSADSEIHRQAIEVKHRTRARFRELAAGAGPADPDVTADQLMLLMEGICATAAERTPTSPPGPGPALARQLLRRGLDPSVRASSRLAATDDEGSPLGHARAVK